MYYMHEIRLSKMFRVQVIHLANCWICFQFISLDTDIRHVKSNKLSPPEDILNHDLREKRNLSPRIQKVQYCTKCLGNSDKRWNEWHTRMLFTAFCRCVHLFCCISFRFLFFFLFFSFSLLLLWFLLFRSDYKSRPTSVTEIYSWNNILNLPSNLPSPLKSVFL